MNYPKNTVKRFKASPRFSLAASAGIFSLVCTTGLLFTTPDAKAQFISVPNFSFEDPALGDGGFTVAFPTGWTRITGGGDIGTENPQNNLYPNTSGTGTLPAPATGIQYSFVNSGSTMSTAAAVTTVDLAQVYILTVSVGNRLDGFTAAQTPTFSIAVGADAATAMVVASQTVTPPAPGTFADFSLTYTPGAAAAGQGLFIRLASPNAATNNQSNFDNVRLNAVPEPSTVALLGLGAVAVTVAARRRRLA